MGIGTGANLQYYDGPSVKELVGVDWSEQMLMKAFTKLDDLKEEQKTVNELSLQGVDVKEQSSEKGLPDVIKLIRADCSDLSEEFEDDSFDTIVDTLTLHSVYDRQ